MSHHVLQSVRNTIQIRLHRLKERLSFLRLLLELRRVIHGLRVLLKVRAGRPTLKLDALARLDSLNRNVLVTTKRTDDSRAVREARARLRRRREKPLEERYSGVDDGAALTAVVSADEQLPVVNNIALDTGNKTR